MLDALNALLKASKKPMCASEIYAADLIGLFESESDCAVKLGNLYRDGYLCREKKANPKAGKAGARSEVFFYFPLAKPVKKPASIRPSRAEKRAAMRDPEPDNEPMPPADPILLAGANRLMHERLEGVAHVLRGCGLEGLKDCEAGEDLQVKCAALAGAYQMAQARITELLEINTALTDRYADLEETVWRISEAHPPKPRVNPLCFAHMWDGGFSMFETEAEARADIHQAFVDDKTGRAEPSHLVAILATAEITVQWKEAA